MQHPFPLMHSKIRSFIDALRSNSIDGLIDCHDAEIVSLSVANELNCLPLALTSRANTADKFSIVFKSGDRAGLYIKSTPL